MNDTVVKQKPQKESAEIRVTRMETALPYLATKTDLANVRTDLKEEIYNVRTELKQDIANVRTELKQDIHSLERRIINRAERDFRFLFGALISVALGLAGMMAKGFHWI